MKVLLTALQHYRCSASPQGQEYGRVASSVSTVSTLCSLSRLEVGVSYVLSVTAVNQLSESSPASINLTMPEPCELSPLCVLTHYNITVVSL